MHSTVYQKKRKKTVIHNKVRFIIFITTSIIFLSLITSFLLNFNKAYSSSYRSYYEVKVVKGDTIWNLAKEHNSSNKNLEKLIYDITKINKLEGAAIMPGDKLKIPK